MISRTIGNGQWDEEEHPRDSHGRFTFSGGGVAGDGDIDPDHWEATASGLNTPQEQALKTRGHKITRSKIEGYSKDEPVGKFQNELPIYEEHVRPNTTWQFMTTPKGIATVHFNSVYGVSDYDRRIEAHWLIAKDRGAGRAAMEMMINKADEHGVTIQLYAVPLKTEGDDAGKTLSKAKLEAFYKEFGFKKIKTEDGYAKMERKPKVAKPSETPRETGSTSGPMTKEEIRATIDRVAKDHNFPSNRIHTHDGEAPFELNGKKYLAAGLAHISRDVDKPYGMFEERLITLYNRQLNRETIDGLISHEIMHIKYQTALNRYQAEYNKLLDDKEAGEALRADGSLKPPFDSKYPAYSAMHEAFFKSATITDFAKADGVSDYSYEWWLNWKAKEPALEKFNAGQSAVHETLAEMARFKYDTGKFPDHMGERILSWRGVDEPRPSQEQMGKNAKLWRDLYRAVDKVWNLKS